MRGPKYGELQVKQHPEAYKYWLTRFDDPEPCEPIYHAPCDDVERADPLLLNQLLKRLKEIKPKLAEVVIRRHFLGQTLLEVAAEFDVTPARVLQIENQAIRKLRASFSLKWWEVLL